MNQVVVAAGRRRVAAVVLGGRAPQLVPQPQQLPQFNRGMVATATAAYRQSSHVALRRAALRAVRKNNNINAVRGMAAAAGGQVLVEQCFNPTTALPPMIRWDPVALEEEGDVDDDG